MNVDPSGLYSFDLTPAFNQQFNNFNIGINSSAIPFPTDLGLNDLGKAAIASFSRMAGLLNVLTLSGDTPQSNREPWYNFYHGTDINSARALVAGKPLSVDAAIQNSYYREEKGKGFYMATDMYTAAFFADRSYTKNLQPAVVNITMQQSTLTTLFSNGAKNNVIGGNNLYLRGREIYIPPSVFPIFDGLRSTGNIRMRLMPNAEWDIPLPKK
ncbi:hypothetical protein [Acinetobacter populi]|nr:hypothetical protein [Acinetobacter populi]